MPRYFFHVIDGQSFLDQEGTELPDRGSARNEAVRLAGALLRDDKGTFSDDHDWRLEVTDGGGLLLFTLHFMTVEAPAAVQPALT
ncbi:DUF6894 family protein [Muricoccus radiodurans]|uniref:DUF6894 family protein n=1 Tax=Muricoccus radiodurans TaxID=2231721 RepID=UPI003CE92C78